VFVGLDLSDVARAEAELADAGSCRSPLFTPPEIADCSVRRAGLVLACAPLEASS
jgi:hypothetical protein